VVVNLLRTEAVIAKAGLWNLREDKTTMPPLARLSVTACSSMRQTELGDRSGRFLKATEGAKNRKEKSRNNKAAPSLQEAAESAIESLLNGSRFFLANPPRSLPVFAPSEVKLGAELGRGEFGTVFEINCLVILDDYAGRGGVESKKEIFDTSDFKGLSDDVNAEDSNKPILTENMGASTRGLNICSPPSSSRPSLNPQLGLSPPSSNMPANNTIMTDPTPAAGEPTHLKHGQSFFFIGRRKHR